MIAAKIFDYIFETKRNVISATSYHYKNVFYSLPHKMFETIPFFRFDQMHSAVYVHM